MHKTINLEQRLRLSILLGLLVVSSLIWAVLFIQGRELKRAASQESFEIVEKQLVAELNALSLPIESQLRQLQSWGEAGLFDGSRPEHLETFFRPVLRSIDAANALIMADSDGRQLFLHRQGDTISASVRKEDSSAVLDTTKYVPKYRPWFQLAADSASLNRVIWSDPYISQPENQPGITAATAWKDSSGKTTVLAFDILLTRLSVLVQSLSVGNGGKVYLVNRNAELFGMNDSGIVASKNDQKTLFVDHSSIEDSVVASVFSHDFRRDRSTQPGLHYYRTKEGNYWVKFLKIEKLLPRYAIMIIAPEKGLNEKIERKAFLLNVVSGAIVAAGLILLLVLLYHSLFTFRLIQNVGELNTIFSNSRDLDSFLDNTVNVIARFMKVPVCSIYLFDESHNKLVLKGTCGLNTKMINEISLEYGEGLVGLTLKELRPIRVAGASSQKGYKRVEGLNEELFDSFLAVPITRGMHKIGVLVVQKRRNGIFTSHMVEILEILASQLTGVLETTGVLLAAGGEIPEFPALQFPVELTEIKGKTASPGYAWGKCSVDHKRDIFTIVKRMNWNKHFTLSDFEQAIESTAGELERLQRLVEERLEDSAAMIFVAHLLMLKDTSFAGAIRNHIGNGVAVPDAVLLVAEDLIRSFASSSARMIQEKAEDVKDLAVRLLSHFSPELNNRQNHRDRIVVARELLPSDILVMASEGVKGVVLVSGGVTSHLAILCRSLQIPLMLTTDNTILAIPPESELLLDANNGMLFINPDKDLLKKYRPLLAGNIAAARPIQKAAITVDGTAVEVHANVNLITDISQAKNCHIEGVGLYRSEFPFMIRESFPNESEQYAIYKKVADYLPRKELTFRTLDIGGDKTLPYLEGVEEENPFLGLRAIRFSLKYEPLFVNQIRAILRAAANTDLRIMFPMIQSLDEFIAAKAIVLRTIEDLQSNGILCHCTPKIGMMVELPAAVTCIEQFAQVCDFFSIGTNDLIQYLLAVDRTNAEVAALYKPHHPAVLMSIAKVANAAQAAGKDLSVCGDMAGNERYIPFLIGCGITKLSVDPVYIPRVQDCISRINQFEAVALTQTLLACNTIAETEMILKGTM